MIYVFKKKKNRALDSRNNTTKQTFELHNRELRYIHYTYTLYKIIICINLTILTDFNSL